MCKTVIAFHREPSSLVTIAGHDVVVADQPYRQRYASLHDRSEARPLIAHALPQQRFHAVYGLCGIYQLTDFLCPDRSPLVGHRRIVDKNESEERRLRPGLEPIQ